MKNRDRTKQPPRTIPLSHMPSLLMDKGYTLVSFLICDDATILSTGKEVLFGVYNDDIVVPNFPARINICFRISIRLLRTNFGHADFRIRSSSKVDRLTSQMMGPRLGNRKTTEQTIFHVTTQIAFQKAERFSAWFRLATGSNDDQPLDEIGWFMVREHTTSEEIDA